MEKINKNESDASYESDASDASDASDGTSPLQPAQDIANQLSDRIPPDKKAARK